MASLIVFMPEVSRVTDPESAAAMSFGIAGAVATMRFRNRACSLSFSAESTESSSPDKDLNAAVIDSYKSHRYLTKHQAEKIL